MDSWTTRGKTVPRVRRQVVDLDVCTAAQPDILAGALARKGSSSCVFSVDNKPVKYGIYILYYVYIISYIYIYYIILYYIYIYYIILYIYIYIILYIYIYIYYKYYIYIYIRYILYPIQSPANLQ